MLKFDKPTPAKMTKAEYLAITADLLKAGVFYYIEKKDKAMEKLRSSIL